MTAGWLAASYQLMKQDALASKLIDNVKPGIKRDPKGFTYERYYDDLSREAQVVYVLAKHFPQRYNALPPAVIENLVKPIAENRFNTYSSAHVILALDAIAALTGTNDALKALAVREVLADGKTRDLTLPPNLMPRVNFTADAKKIQFANGGDTTAFFVVNQSGFDVAPPATELKQNLEILREYTDASGKSIKSVKQGDEIDVHLKFRAIGRPAIDSVVFVDLLPGGFELVLDSKTPPNVGRDAASDKAQQTEGSANAQGSDNEGEGESQGEPQAEQKWVTPIGGWKKSTWQPDYVDLREDRVVLYGAIDKAANAFVYRIKATHAGTFVTPPAYGEGLYDRTVKARSTGGSITVEKR